eukprot:IDg19328t1
MWSADRAFRFYECGGNLRRIYSIQMKIVVSQSDLALFTLQHSEYGIIVLFLNAHSMALHCDSLYTFYCCEPVARCSNTLPPIAFYRSIGFIAVLICAIFSWSHNILRW